MTDKPSETREGYYEIVFDLGEVRCPTRWDISKDGITIINADERIPVSAYRISGDSASFVLPVFGTTVNFFFTAKDSLHGFFRDQHKKEIIRSRLRVINLRKILHFQKNQTFDLRMMSL